MLNQDSAVRKRIEKIEKERLEREIRKRAFERKVTEYFDPKRFEVKKKYDGDWQLGIFKKDIDKEERGKVYYQRQVVIAPHITDDSKVIMSASSQIYTVKMREFEREVKALSRLEREGRAYHPELELQRDSLEMKFYVTNRVKRVPVELFPSLAQYLTTQKNWE